MDKFLVIVGKTFRAVVITPLFYVLWALRRPLYFLLTIIEGLMFAVLIFLIMGGDSGTDRFTGFVAVGIGLVVNGLIIGFYSSILRWMAPKKMNIVQIDYY